MASCGTNVGPDNAIDIIAQEGKPKANTSLPHTVDPRDHATTEGDGVPKQTDGDPHPYIYMAAAVQSKQATTEGT